MNLNQLIDMSKEEKQRKNKLTELKKGLKSKEDSEVVKSIKALKVYGDPSVAPDIFDVLLQHQDNDVELETLGLLASLKDTQMPQVMMDSLAKEKYLPIRQKLMSTIWQSGLNYSSFLKDIVNIAVEGSFMEKVECITIIENLDGPFEEEQIMESLLILNKYFDDSKDNDQEKHIMKELIIIIKDIQE